MSIDQAAVIFFINFFHLTILPFLFSCPPDNSIFRHFLALLSQFIEPSLRDFYVSRAISNFDRHIFPSRFLQQPTKKWAVVAPTLRAHFYLNHLKGVGCQLLLLGGSAGWMLYILSKFLHFL